MKMLINKNRITDSSLIIQDLELTNTIEVSGQNKTMEVKKDRNTNGTTHEPLANPKTGAPLEEDLYQRHDLNNLKRLLKVLAGFMAVFGIYNIDFFSENKHPRKDGTDKNSRPTKFRLHSTYCYIVLACLTGNWIRSIVAFFIGEHSKEYFTFRITTAVWSLQVALNAFIMVKASHPTYGNLIKACRMWDTDVVKWMTSLHVGLNTKKVKRFLAAVLVIGTLSMVINISVLPMFLFLQNSTFSVSMSNVFIAPFPETDGIKVMLCLVVVFMTVSWIVPIMYLVALCFVVRSGFKVCTNALASTIAVGKETNTYPMCLYRQRMLHLNMCRCLEVIDKDIKYVYASMFFTNIPLACFLLYQMLKTELGILEISALSFWLCSNVLFVTLTTISGASVNTAAHSPLDCIYDVGMKGITMEQLGQLNLFTSKLNGGAIGFTVMSFVPITKEVILTVFGLYVTYFFILLQF